MKYYYIGYQFYTKTSDIGIGSRLISTKDLNISKIERDILKANNTIRTIIIISAIEISKEVWNEDQ